jgi:hypothetical protein
MNAKRLLQPQILIAILLLLILVAVMIFVYRSSDGPNTGTFTVEAIGIVVNQKGTCAEVQPAMSHSGVLCAHAPVLGRKGECVTFIFNNFSPHIADPKHAQMSLCQIHGRHAPSW